MGKAPRLWESGSARQRDDRIAQQLGGYDEGQHRDDRGVLTHHPIAQLDQQISTVRRVVRVTDGRVVWDADAYAFLDADCPDTVNPSLWRPASARWEDAFAGIVVEP